MLWTESSLGLNVLENVNIGPQFESLERCVRQPGLTVSTEVDVERHAVSVITSCSCCVVVQDDDGVSAGDDQTRLTLSKVHGKHRIPQ